MPKLIIDGVIGFDITANFVRDFLNKNENTDVTVEISTPGGFVFEGITIYNLLKAHTGKVTTHNISLAASMGSVIALAGDVIKANDNATFMIHNASSFASGDHKEMRKTADFVEALTNVIAKIYVNKTGKTLDEILEMMSEETWLFGDEIKEAGFADEIIKTEKKQDKKTNLLDANLRVKQCINIMKESERSKNDINKAAALLKIDDPKNHQPVNIQIEPVNNNVAQNSNVGNIIDDQNLNKTEVKNMTPEEIKNKYPEAYKEIFALGVQSIQDNIEAHAEWFEADPKNVIEAIKKNEPYNVKHAAKYSKAQLNKNDIQAQAADSQAVGNINTPSIDVGNKLMIDSFQAGLDGSELELSLEEVIDA